MSSRQSAALLFVNDKVELNQRYRSGLIAAAETAGWTVSGAGLFDADGICWPLLIRLIGRPPQVVVSNLRANLVLLALGWLRGLVILNGLGRYRQKSTFRSVLLLLIQLNRRKQLAIQSYADYRYLRRYGDSRRCHWVPGSGGKSKPFGSEAIPVLVQRDDKLPLVAESARTGLEALAQYRSESPRVCVVGCRQDVTRYFEGYEVRNVGFVPASRILASGSIFLQPSGYGEGFPHSLADAIVSGMNLVMSHREFIRYGLWRIGAIFEPIGQGWGTVHSSEALRTAVSEPVVSAGYLELLQLAVGRPHE